MYRTFSKETKTWTEELLILKPIDYHLTTKQSFSSFNLMSSISAVASGSWWFQRELTERFLSTVEISHSQTGLAHVRDGSQLEHGHW